MSDDKFIGEKIFRVEPWVLLLSAAAVIPIWVTPYPPLQDLPNHLLKVDILLRWMHGEAWVLSNQIKDWCSPPPLPYPGGCRMQIPWLQATGDFRIDQGARPTAAISPCALPTWVMG